MSKSRQQRRMEGALEEIASIAGLAAKHAPEGRDKDLFAVFARRAENAINPRPDGDILKDWNEAEITESIAAIELGVSRVEARQMLIE
jgi:radical SAM superfamily enzyme with C-terminal helix-hairpin-helix motif